jgi:hypothetical protein
MSTPNFLASRLLMCIDAGKRHTRDVHRSLHLGFVLASTSSETPTSVTQTLPEFSKSLALSSVVAAPTTSRLIRDRLAFAVVVVPEPFANLAIAPLT